MKNLYPLFLLVILAACTNNTDQKPQFELLSAETTNVFLVTI